MNKIVQSIYVPEVCTPEVCVQWDIHPLASQLDALDNLQAEQWSTSVG